MYLGNQPALSYTSFAKQDFTTSATTSYVLDYPVTNENEIALFINFVRQEPTTAYTASGTSLTLTSATSASDDMYAIFLGKAVQTVNPPAGSVGISQLSATGTKDSTTFLRGDNTFTTVVSGLTVADQWRLTTSFSATSTTDITSNLERVDTSGQGTLGTGMTESSGIFTFPSTGIYLVNFTSGIEKNGDIRFVRSEIYVTINNSTYTKIAHNGMFLQQTLSNDAGGNSITQSLIDVTDTSNVKVKFAVAPDGTATIRGSSTLNDTHMTFIRLGDT